jgi:hypothetical protein
LWLICRRRDHPVMPPAASAGALRPHSVDGPANLANLEGLLTTRQEAARRRASRDVGMRWRVRKPEREVGERLALLREALDQGRGIEQTGRLEDQLFDIERDLNSAICIAGLRAGVSRIGNAGRLIQAGVNFLRISLYGSLGDLGVHGRDTLTFGATGRRRAWKMQREFLSPCYTTNWNDLLRI